MMACSAKKEHKRRQRAADVAEPCGAAGPAALGMAMMTAAVAMGFVQGNLAILLGNSPRRFTGSASAIRNRVPLIDMSEVGDHRIPARR